LIYLTKYLNEYILRLEVSVNDSSRMKPLESADNLNKENSGCLFRQFTVAFRSHSPDEAIEIAGWIVRHNKTKAILVSQYVYERHAPWHALHLPKNLDLSFDGWEEILFLNECAQHSFHTVDVEILLVPCQIGETYHA
jgi:hypothetical protein